MKVKLIIKDENDRRILQNAENTARRVEQWPAWKRNAYEQRPIQDQSETNTSTNSDSNE